MRGAIAFLIRKDGSHQFLMPGRKLPFEDRTTTYVYIVWFREPGVGIRDKLAKQLDPINGLELYAYGSADEDGGNRILRGANEIAEFIGVESPKVAVLQKNYGLPVWKFYERGPWRTTTGLLLRWYEEMAFREDKPY